MIGDKAIKFAFEMISIKNISKTFDTKKALNNISFDIPKGSIYGLLGQNGAGKTTLIRIINQIYEADFGKILINNEPLNPNHILKIGYLPEERGLYKKLKVLNQLIYFGKLRGLSKSKATENAKYWLDKMLLNDVKNKKTEELSKGMQQKIQFIISILHEPEFLILDEPFSGLDPINAELLSSIIKEINQKGTTILFSTHRMENLEQLCDSIAIIHQSKLIIDGNINDIQKKHSQNIVKIVCENPLLIQNEGLKVIHEEINQHKQYIYQLSYQDDMDSKSIFNLISEHQEILKFEKHIPSVGELFVKLIQE